MNGTDNTTTTAMGQRQQIADQLEQLKAQGYMENNIRVRGSRFS